MKKRHLLASAAFTLSSLALGPALAQTSSSQDTDKTAQSESTDLEPIIVTGTRLKTQYNGDRPIQIVRPEDGLNAGLVDTVGLLSRSTATGSQQVNNHLSATGAGGAVSVGGTNANTIGLRDLGATRTLTLMDGRRLTPAGVGSQVGPVDLNVVPASIIDHIEVLTDGASSIYGSDAVAGVVNIITRRASDGLEVNAYSTVNTKGGGNYRQGSLFWGKEFGGGYINIGAEFNDQQSLKVRQRPETACAQDYVYNPTTGARMDLQDQNGAIKCRNLNPTGVFFDETFYLGWFQYDPTLSKAQYPAAALNLRRSLPDWVRVARGGYPDTYPYGTSNSEAYQNADSISPLRRSSVYVSGAYKFDNGIEAYGNLLLNRRESESNSWMFLYPILDPTNPNNTVANGLINASGGNSSGAVQVQMNMPYKSTQTVNYGQATAGLRGAIPSVLFLKDVSWDVSTQYGRSDGTYSQNFFYNDRLQATTGPGTACDPSLITISGPVSCVSIPWLDPRFLVDQNWTPQERAFLQGSEKGHTTYDQASLDGSVSASLFKLPAGTVDLATGFALRYQRLDDVPGANARASNYFGFSTAGVTEGSDTVRELFAEMGVPILADLPMVNKLNLNLSGRYTDYRSYGSDTTYKVGLSWQVIPEVTFRGSMGTSFRAPTLYELYLANQTSFFPYSDPCVRYGDTGNPSLTKNCSALGIPSDFQTSTGSILATQGGGKGDLKAETSRNYTVGAAFRPRFADLQVAADYYDINVKNEVAAYGVNAIINQCYNSPAQSGNVFCSKVTRDPTTHIITAVDNRLVNLSRERNRGVDLSVDYGVEVPFGRLGVTGAWTWTVQHTLHRDETSSLDINGLSGNPMTNGWVEGSIQHGAWQLFYGINYIGPTNDARLYSNGDLMTYCGAYAGLTTYGNRNNCAQVRELLRVSSYITHYMSVRWQMDDSMRLQLGVSNLWDKKPPVEGSDSYTYRTGSVPSTLYNLTGRSVFARVSKTF
ncbi:TonB-dependent receptor [Nitrospirillum sp. BR 11752]|uniref:TonB-dependent receptor domain-containing protein n=1 Tax=Nitrospirillum sp. BR 11752 TaxID=3104293 RepID=UPI002EB4DFBD|nr:TonB-dependent receptor [Nitrospirillum sp. BR 11752]